mmetsp:Transcript_20383/g.43695  ORF Transcript_20383/g.43695 Transcript_20383/m.43695 type:complete len:812 (+) Transcript_20383:141-2576(+)|eukprot:CAMPEP_0172555420 /NCGR_PEP_ID=MMETSP1067-20121228/58407_1 /TAXON_ID=265564 ORGANISM="Thalassiosira punctigera, Strain Tpunct2005C2" /NCGR_SAMPLE_ID=MMETSP1067 /ASSEMBLY_ACC=CAM_ASM_000444 /LENGTH=811 /DNA_ID=CAMNT_0013343941 /DNA_START=99 /DNA_END=2534 /DNA_ORIENTATION=+
MFALPFFFLLIQHNVGLMASALLRPNIGFPGQPWRLSHRQNLKKRWLHPLSREFLISKYNPRLGILLSSTTDNDLSLDDMLEKFALPLEFKKGSSVRDVTAIGDGDNAGSEVESSSSVTDKLVPSDKNSDKTTIADSFSFKPSPDTPLANKYYLKKMQLPEEPKKIGTVLEEINTETKETPTPTLPAAPPRRRFSDFGIASEQAEAINGEASIQNSGPSASQDSTTTTMPRGFTDFSIRQPRPVKVSTERASNTISSSANAKALGDSSNPTPGDNEKNPAAPVAKEEVALATKSPFKDDQISAAESTLEKAKATPAKPTNIDEITTPSPIVMIAQPSSNLVQAQPASPINPLVLPSLDLDMEDFGLLPLIIIGISVYLSLGVYLKQDNEKGDEYAGWDEVQKRNDNEKEPGLIGKFTKESKNLFQKVKDAGTAGAISYALWEAAFWGVSFPVCLVSYRQVTGHWPDVMNGEDVRKVGLQAFAFVNFARLAVPVRIGLALSTVPWVEKNIVNRFQRLQREEEGLYDDQGMTSEGYSGNDVMQQEGSDAQAIGNVREADSKTPQPQLSFLFNNKGNIQNEDTSVISEMEKRVNKLETEATRISSTALDNVNAGIDPTLLQKKKKEAKRRYVPGNNYLGSIEEYCEPGQVDENCSESIQGYLDTLANTGAVATDGEVKSIVSYLDSVSSNVTPNKKRGAAFTSYLDALSTGYVPAPPSAKAVASYLDLLSSSDEIISSASSSATGEGAQSNDGDVSSRINEVEVRLSRLESSITSLPDDIASRLVDWQMSQDKKLNDEMEKIMKLLVEGKSLEK